MEINKLAIIGTGSMGSMMSLLFAEHGCQVSIFDPSKKNRDLALKHADEAGFSSKITACEDYASLCATLRKPKVFLFSVPHGTVGDGIVEQLHPYLEKGDIIIDGSNEHWENTQRRQAKMAVQGVSYVGMGVSGGYQAARSGPSMSPGGDEPTLDAVMPLLRKVAARDREGNPCVAKMGPGGSGHYVKMVHNGIEHGMMSALCEIWGIMKNTLGMSYEEIASTWEGWNATGGLADNFLISIGIEICRTVDPSTSQPLVDLIRDKVVQDVDESEGTGVWSCMEGMRLHVPISTLTAAHQFRLGSAYSIDRNAAATQLRKETTGTTPQNTSSSVGLGQPTSISIKDKSSTLESLRLALYASFLSSFAQGLHLLSAASAHFRWSLSFPSILSIWRGGCIIRSDALSSLLLSALTPDETPSNLLANRTLAPHFAETFSPLKSTVQLATEHDAYIPALSATLEWLKYSTAVEGLPTSFMEAELDYFGKHMFEVKMEKDSGKPETGEWHFGWKAAKGVEEERKITKQ